MYAFIYTFFLCLWGFSVQELMFVFVTLENPFRKSWSHMKWS